MPGCDVTMLPSGYLLHASNVNYAFFSFIKSFWSINCANCHLVLAGGCFCLGG